MFEHNVRILQKLVIRKTHDPYTGLLECHRPPGVVLNTICVVVLTAIQFDGDLPFLAEEIQNVTSERYLSAELETAEPAIAEVLPEFNFSVGRLATHRSGECEEFRVCGNLGRSVGHVDAF